MVGKDGRPGITDGRLYDDTVEYFLRWAIDSTTGVGTSGGDVGIRDSLTAYGATLSPQP